ncbi:MAG: RDD family protein [Armatimonadota bacterium]
MSRTLEIATPENVTIRYELAGFGSRGAAAVIDALFLFLIYLLLAGVVSLFIWLKFLPGWEAMADWAKEMAVSILVGVGILVFFVTHWLYYIAFETLWNGETPGKRIMGLRVIKDGGYPVDFRAVLTRNLLRAVDSLPAIPLVPSYGLAFVVILFNADHKRLGDYAAGTLVIRHSKDGQKKKSLFGEAETFRLLDRQLLSQLSRLNRDEYRMVQRFLERRGDLPPALRGEFARRLAQPLIEKFDYQPPALGMDHERWLEELDLAYRTRALGPAQVSTPRTSTLTASRPASDPPPQTAPSDARKW